MIVVDASVLVDALIDDGAVGERARAALLQDLHWAAPAHVVVEVVSAVRGRVLGGKLGVRRAGAALRALQELTIESVDPTTLVDRMWELRSDVTAYDAAYLAAAESLDCALVTADASLGRVSRLRLSGSGNRRRNPQDRLTIA